MGETGDAGLAADEDEVLRLIAENAARHRDLVAQLEQGRAIRIASATERPTFASYAAAVLDGRKLLGRFIPGEFFGDPAFDMLLDLLVAAERGEARMVKACIIASRVPPTTALRYLDLMEARGLIEKESDPNDARRVLVKLTASTQASMHDWLSAICSIPLRRGLRDLEKV